LRIRWRKLLLIVLPVSLLGRHATFGFMDEESEAQKDLEICPKSPSWFMAEIEF
jgi:hypothetical protein